MWFLARDQDGDPIAIVEGDDHDDAEVTFLGHDDRFEAEDLVEWTYEPITIMHKADREEPGIDKDELAAQKADIKNDEEKLR